MTGRNLDLERDLLDAIAHRARRHFGVNCHAYVRRVQLRLRVGAQRYGDNLHDGRDLIGELLEETPDVAGYALLELQRLGDQAPAGVRDDLLRAAMCGAVADYYARRAARRLRHLRHVAHRSSA